MLKKNLLPLLLLSSITLSGCFSLYKKVNEEDFESYLTESLAYIKSGEEIKDVSIKSRLNITTYDYKEGEFYRYNYFVFVLIPVSQNESTWVKDGKYYHYTYNSLTNKTTYSEITKDRFDLYMLEHKEKIKNELALPVMEGISYINSKEEKNYNLKCEVNSSKEYRITNKYTVENSSENVSAKAVIKYKNHLPISEEKKTGDSKDTMNYTYGEAEFIEPKVEDSQS